MRIAYFINQYPKVSHSFVRREIQALERLGVEVMRIALRSDRDELVDPRDVEEFEKTRLLLSEPRLRMIWLVLARLLQNPSGWFKALKLTFSAGWGSERGLLRHFAYFVEACTLVDWTNTGKVEHIHAHFGTNSTTVVMIARELGGPSYSFTVHGPDEFDMPEFISLGEKIKRSAFTVGISSFGRSQLLRRIPHDQWDKVTIVRCGIDKAFFEGELPPVPDVPRLVCVGRLCEQKGQQLLVDAMRELFDEGLEFKLVLAGDGPMRKDIEERITRQGLGDNVQITGWISSEEVRRQISKSRALVLPSFAEGLPVVIMEAMALKRPVITTYIAGTPELVEPGKSGWLFPAGTVPPLKEAIRNCLETPVEQLREMGEIARDQVKRQHDIDIEAQKLLESFKKHARSGQSQSSASIPMEKPDHIAVR